MTPKPHSSIVAKHLYLDLPSDIYSALLERMSRISVSAPIILALLRPQALASVNSWPPSNVTEFFPRRVDQACLQLFLKSLPANIQDLNLIAYFVDDEILSGLLESPAAATLQKLKLDESRIVDALTMFEQLTSLETLSLGHASEISDESMSIITRMTSLKSLEASSIPQKGSLLQLLINHSNPNLKLEKIQLSISAEEAADPQTVHALVEANQNLHSIYLTPNLRSGHISMKNLTNLQNASLPDTTVEDALLSYPTSLQSLAIKTDEIFTRDAVDTVLESFPYLTSLRILCRSIDPSIRFHLATNLRSLYITSYSPFPPNLEYDRDRQREYDEFVTRLCADLPQLDHLNIRCQGPWRKFHAEQVLNQLTGLKKLNFWAEPRAESDNHVTLTHPNLSNIPYGLLRAFSYRPLYLPELCQLSSSNIKFEFIDLFCPWNLPRLCKVSLDDAPHREAEKVERLVSQLNGFAPQLISLDVSGDIVERLAFRHFRNLKILDISATTSMSSQKLKDMLAAIPYLNQLNLYDVASIQDFKWLSHKRLECLWVRGSGVETVDEIEVTAEQCPALQELRLSATAEKLVLRNLSRLHTLSFEECLFKQVIVSNSSPRIKISMNLTEASITVYRDGQECSLRAVPSGSLVDFSELKTRSTTVCLV